MKLHLINPNTTAHMTRQMQTTAQQVASPGTIVTGLTAPHGPASIECHYDEAMSIVGIADAVRTAIDDQSDGMILGCFGDPHIWAIRELSPVPVIGIAQAAFIAASLVSTRFAVVTSLQRTVIQCEHLLQLYGYDRICQSVSAVDLPVLELDDDFAVQQIIVKARQAIDNGAGAIVLGCGGMAHLRQQIEQAIETPVIDGVQSATRQLEALVGLGLLTSKTGDLAFPVIKPYAGELKRFGHTDAS